MSAAGIHWADYLDNVRSQVPPLHPAAECTVYELLAEARDAAERGNDGEVARLLAIVRNKVLLELQSEMEDNAAAAETLGLDAAIEDERRELEQARRLWGAMS